MKIYSGVRPCSQIPQVHVTGDGMEYSIMSIQPSKAVREYVTNVFNWGQAGGNGALQLAIALVLDATKSPELAMAVHEEFEAQIVSRLGPDTWVLTEDVIREWINKNYTPPKCTS